MEIGIDSYCFHRYFGEVYPGLQADPGTRWRMEGEFLDFALKQDVGEIALEACFFDALDDGLCAEIKARLDETGVDRVLGWGHPEGLWGGDKPEELDALKRHLPQTRKLGSTRMRIVAASMNYAKSPREELIGKVVPMLAEATKAAEDEGVVLALENHIDFTSRGAPTDHRGGGLAQPAGQLRHRQLPAPVRGPRGRRHPAGPLHHLDAHQGHRHPAQRRRPVGQLHLVAGVRGRRGRHRHARGGQSPARRRF